VEGVGGLGAAIWSRPPEVRRAIAELAGVFPVTHLALDFDAVRASAGPEPTWKALLGRSGGWTELLGELVPAIASALRAPCVFGFALPDPRAVAAELGDTSDRGALKAGLQVASFLQSLRSAGLSFAIVLLGSAPTPEVTRAVTPVLRNAGMYGWRRAVEMPTLDASLPPETDLRLVPGAKLADLEPAWNRGEEVGGGLETDLWTDGSPVGKAPPLFCLYGIAPAGVDAAATVAAGRRLREWTSS
jgi:hypothetical protein